MIAHNESYRGEDVSSLEHFSHAHRALISKKDSAFQEGDLFAAYLLAVTNARRRNPHEFSIHLQGFLTTLRHLQQRGAVFTLSPFLRMAALDLNWHARTLDDVSFLRFWKDLTCLMGPTTRQQCEGYMTEILESKPKPLARLLSIVESLWTTYSFLKRCLRMAIGRDMGEGGVLDVSAEGMIAQAKTLLQSLEISDNVAQYEIETGCQGADRYTKWTAWFPCFVYHTCKFFISLLEADPILQGLRAPSERSALGRMIGGLAGDFVQFCPADWRQPGLTVFWLAGLAFPPLEFPESIPKRCGSWLTVSIGADTFAAGTITKCSLVCSPQVMLGID
jgi:hypothetical protein